MAITATVCIEGFDGFEEIRYLLGVVADMQMEMLRQQRRTNRRLARLLHLEKERDEEMDVDLSDIKTKVSKLTDTVDSAETAFQELAAKIKELGDRPNIDVAALQAELTSLGDAIEQDSGELAAAVASSEGPKPSQG